MRNIKTLKYGTTRSN